MQPGQGFSFPSQYGYFGQYPPMIPGYPWPGGFAAYPGADATATPSTTAPQNENKTIGDWTRYKTDNGRYYYHNSSDSSTRWDPPDCFAEDRKGKQLWTSHLNPEGKTYFYNQANGESVWEKPKDFGALITSTTVASNDAAASSPGQPTAASATAPVPVNPAASPTATTTTAPTTATTTATTAATTAETTAETAVATTAETTTPLTAETAAETTVETTSETTGESSVATTTDPAGTGVATDTTTSTSIVSTTATTATSTAVGAVAPADATTTPTPATLDAVASQVEGKTEVDAPPTTRPVEGGVNQVAQPSPGVQSATSANGTPAVPNGILSMLSTSAPPPVFAAAPGLPTGKLESDPALSVKVEQKLDETTAPPGLGDKSLKEGSTTATVSAEELQKAQERVAAQAESQKETISEDVLTKTPYKPKVEYNKEEAHKAFHQLLADAEIKPSWKWQDTLPKIIHDPRYRVIKTLSERKILFHSWQKKQKEKEKEERRAKSELNERKYIEMLKESDDLDTDMRFRDVEKLFEKDPRFMAVDDPDDRHDYWYRYIKGVIKQERKKRKEQRVKNMDAFDRLIRKTDVVTYDCHWRDVQERFRGEGCVKALEKIDLLRVFDEYQKELAEKHRREEHTKRQLLKKEHAKQRQRFKALLAAKLQDELFHAKSRWDEVVPLIKDDARFGQMQQETTPEQLFEDFCDDLEDKITSTKKCLKELMKENGIVVHTTDNIDSVCEKVGALNHPKYTEMKASHARLVFHEMIGKAKYKAELKVKKKTQYKESFDRLLRKKKVNQCLEWSEVKEALASHTSYRKLSEEERIDVFVRYMDLLREKGKVRPTATASFNVESTFAALEKKEAAKKEVQDSTSESPQDQAGPAEPTNDSETVKDETKDVEGEGKQPDDASGTTESVLSAQSEKGDNDDGKGVKGEPQNGVGGAGEDVDVEEPGSVHEKRDESDKERRKRKSDHKRRRERYDKSDRFDKYDRYDRYDRYERSDRRHDYDDRYAPRSSSPRSDRSRSRSPAEEERSPRSSKRRRSRKRDEDFSSHSRSPHRHSKRHKKRSKRRRKDKKHRSDKDKNNDGTDQERPDAADDNSPKTSPKDTAMDGTASVSPQRSGSGRSRSQGRSASVERGSDAESPNSKRRRVD